MKIYKCVICGDEVLCDNDVPLKELDDAVYVVPGGWIEVGGENFGPANVDEDADEGAAAENLDDQKQKVIDVVHQNRLVETTFDKKSFMATIKGYMKKLKEKLDKDDPARSAGFQAAAQTFVKKVIADFDDYQFFLGPSMSDEGIVVLCKWEGENAFFYFWKDGLKGERV